MKKLLLICWALFSLTVSAQTPDRTCCRLGQWGPINISGIGLVHCSPGQNPFRVNCREFKTFTISYRCNPTLHCQASFDIISKNTGTGVRTILVASAPIGSPVNVQMPSAPGNYQIIIYPKCKGTICDSCIIPIRVDCVDCCQGGFWGLQKLNNRMIQCTRFTPATPGLTFPPVRPLVANFIYHCRQQSDSCKAKIRYELRTNGQLVPGSMVWANSGINRVIAPQLQPGTYCLKAYAYCNDTTRICDSCQVCFNVSCNICDSTVISVKFNVDQFAFVGSIQSLSAARLIQRVIVELVELNAKDRTFGRPIPPNPNFEFVHQPPALQSTIGGTSVSLPFSLRGTRSNVAVSRFATPQMNIPIRLFVADREQKVVTGYKLKFILIFEDGSYCTVERFFPSTIINDEK